MHFNIADLLERAADTLPDREALVAGGQRLTFRQLDERATRLGHHLRAAGISRGEHVGIHAYNCAEFVESMYAAYKIGAVPINVNYRYVEDELRYLFGNADLVAVIHQRRFAPRIAAIRAELPKLRHFVVIDDESGEDSSALGSVEYEAALASGSPQRDFEPRSGDDLYILYTGGTTGMPKGVIWRQVDVIMALGGGIDHATGIPHEKPEELAAKGQAGAPMTTLVIPPLMHGAAQWGTMQSHFTGGKVVLYSETSFAADRLWKLIDDEKVNTITITGDAMARPLVEELEKGDWDASSLIVVASSAAVFSPTVKQQFKRRLPNLIIVDSIGSSESGFNGTGMYQGEGKAEGVVRVAPGTDSTVLDENGDPLEPGSGVVGKLARKGNIPLGYYNDPVKTAQTFIEKHGTRWAVPGDFARLEADGTIVLLGRGSECVNSGGEKIFPEEVEAALKSHPDVFDAVVVGLPDERWGEHVTAVVQPRPGASPSLDTLVSHCRNHIAGYKVPRELLLIDEIQRQPSGKPNYPWARKWALNVSRKA
jgi:acyl-CoA synthetase (AMP-forming)/AMP-acid ligase II